MRKGVSVHIPLVKARLCADLKCSSVFEDYGPCPACAGTVSLPLSSVLNRRKGNAKSLHMDYLRTYCRRLYKPRS
jgi:hypothetical protein